MTNLEKIIADNTDADGLLDMDKVILKYASRKTESLVVKSVMDYIYKNKVKWKIMTTGEADSYFGKRNIGFNKIKS